MFIRGLKRRVVETKVTRVSDLNEKEENERHSGSDWGGISGVGVYESNLKVNVPQSKKDYYGW